MQLAHPDMQHWVIGSGGGDVDDELEDEQLRAAGLKEKLSINNNKSNEYHL